MRSWKESIQVAKVRPLGPNTFPCNTYAHPIDVTKLPMGLLGRLGLKAIQSLYWGWETSAMDRWCFWRALTEKQQKRLIYLARQAREYRCRECGRRMEDNE